VPRAAQSLSARASQSDGTTSQAVGLPLDSGRTDACMHVGVGGGRDRFSSIKNGGATEPAAAQSLREC